MDIKIFFHYLAKLKMNDRQSEIKIHHLFPINPYRIAFKESADVDAFNQVLVSYIATKNYQELIKKYNF